ncbi:probable disease resistance protein At4g27220 [Juglans microcarpa x Juglans regia]|uniref:probable disease resistance protein At4g27220 n=1 Tax=Juglans microcarpa x Juglans regia TaxID=2249226 RepID=UPI001B7E9F8A|nr:probable disease resistance protein At4g27220 [Juglans microcarpa x Juglans regia]
MEVVSSIVSGAVVETGRPLCGSIYSTIKNIVKGPQQLDLLESKMKSLMALRNDAEEEMTSAKRDGKVIKEQATVWVGEVDKLQYKINDQIQEAKSSRCFLSCSTKRYKISREVPEHLTEIERLRAEGKSLAGSVALNYSEFKAVAHFPGPSIKDQTASVSEDLAKITTLLSDDRYQRIGIWGMGGVGKTNLVRNLNNELENNSNRPFTFVQWVIVSKNLDMKRLQKEIAERLCLKMEESSGADGMAAKLRQRLKEERFLLILDDVWEKIDLDKLGVPRLEDPRGSKIILTSRSLDVCRNMMLTDVDIKVSVLRDEDAWQLFSRYATDVVSLEHITPLAEAICKECKGLPLAIITMGAAMRGKTKLELWNHALKQLRRSVPYAIGVEEELYKPLKWSYDSLEGKDLKACFLYCSLFPEDFSIEIDELVWYWLAEGLIDDREKYEDFYSRGISLIENLKDACLLEDGSYVGTVKMHDVVRDVSIWIACSEDGSKFLVRSGNGLKEISATELSNSLKRVSFMNNDLERLPDDESVIQCSEASTLLLQNNPRLDLIPERFLKGFEALRVLNISGTGIKSLPVSLLQLDDLRALLLNHCWDLKELPSLERLCKLLVLDLSWTGIRELPRGLEQLSNLRHLILKRTQKLKAVKGGVISKLSRLEVLDMSDSNYNWKVKGGVNEEEACIEELECLERLQFLAISLEWVPSHSCQDTIISLTNRLKGFQITIVRPDHPVNYPGRLYARPDAQSCVTMAGIDLSGGQIGWWLSIASHLRIISCRGLNEMLQDLVINSVGSFTYLKKLHIYDSSFRTGGRAAQHDLLPNLEQLILIDMTGIESISELVYHLGLRLQRLIQINVIGCSEIKYLLSLGNSIRTMPNLELIQVSYCSNLEELFNYLPLYEINMAPDPITPKLQKLELENLPKLRNLCGDEKTWPGNKVKVDVTDCDLLST